jgi:outer membrane protein OmpA-like peptidoglycan-associated protein
MTSSLRSIALAAGCAFLSVAAAAQTPSSQTQPPATGSAATSSETRPATTTFSGDTGLWYVPTAEVLGHGKWSASGYRRGTNWIQGYSNVADFAATFAFGIRDRAEIFGSFIVDTRIDRDIRPIFVTANTIAGGVIDRYPRVNQGWTGDNIGDFTIGAKFNLMSEADQHPFAVALRTFVKLPTGDKDIGVSTGKADVGFDGVVSKEAAKLLELSGYAGWEVRGKPDGFSAAPSGDFRWGMGGAFPSRNFIRLVGEVNGNHPTGKLMTASPQLVGTDLSKSPVSSITENIARATVGVTVQSKRGLFGGIGVSWNVPTEGRNAANNPEGDVLGDYYDVQVRIGYHPGARTFVPPPPPPPPAAPAAPAPQNRPPTVRARCEPCTVEVGQASTVTADAQDPDGDTLTYRWSAPTGTFANAGDRQTRWTAPQQEGAVPVTVAVNDGKGGTASDSVTIQVMRPKPVVELTFEDVYFDFDRSSLRPEALRLLDDAIAKLQANPDKSIVIEGHTCNIGTAEYNLALGNRRATSVRDYLQSRGVTANRMETRSFGEERPKYDNAREETRRLNRRAALVVRVQ